MSCGSWCLLSKHFAWCGGCYAVIVVVICLIEPKTRKTWFAQQNQGHCLFDDYIMAVHRPSRATLLNIENGDYNYHNTNTLRAIGKITIVRCDKCKTVVFMVSKNIRYSAHLRRNDAHALGTQFHGHTFSHCGVHNII